MFFFFNLNLSLLALIVINPQFASQTFEKIPHLIEILKRNVFLCSKLSHFNNQNSNVHISNTLVTSRLLIRLFNNKLVNDELSNHTFRIFEVSFLNLLIL